MKKILPMIIGGLVIITLIVLSTVFNNFNLDEVQLKTLKIISIVCFVSVMYCFIVGELSRNNSQMDKLWSVLPIIYALIILIMGKFKLRLVLYSIVVLIWGVRLTINFAKKGAYKLKFWEGEEDYRWKILRAKKPFNNKLVWGAFDLFFISAYQNILVLSLVFPMLVVMQDGNSFNVVDIISLTFACSFLLLEVVADKQQWHFQETKKAKLKEGKFLEELEYPYNLGFNTVGLWSRFRHPNYLGEQGIWISLYLLVMASGYSTYIFSWSLIGPLLLILLFMGSSTLAEGISSSKYPKYKDYQEQVFKYLPIKKYKND